MSRSVGRSEASDAVIGLGRRVAGAGLVVGAGGNISARTGPDEILVTPSGWALDDLDEQRLVVLGLDGQVRHPAQGAAQALAGGAKPSSESSMHLAAHRARPDIGVALHLHPPHANLLVATGRPIRCTTLYHAYYVRGLAHVPYLPSGTVELADAVAAGLGQTDVVLLAHHGCLVVGADADLAFERAVNLESAATATFRALLLGDTTTVCPPEYMERMRALEAEAGGPVYGKGT
ncbi:MAG: class II aldolase/adducin family protein [Acidimicrobiales bacterium]